MKFILSLISDSITLDFITFLIKEWSPGKKIEFLFKKYLLIVKHFFKKFKLGKDFVYFCGDKVYYNSKYGLAGYQRTFCSHGDMLRNYVSSKEPKVIFDVGANVGYFSQLCRDFYPASEIYAFEPIPQTFDCLNKNLKDDDKNNLYNLGLMNFKGKSKMDFREQDSALSSMSSDGNTDVEITTLDIFCEEKGISKIDILKIDTETFENFVLEGASEVLSNVKYLVIEVTVEDNENYTVSSLFKLLSGQGFNFQLLWFRSFSAKAEGKAGAFDVLLENVFCNVVE